MRKPTAQSRVRYLPLMLLPLLIWGMLFSQERQKIEEDEDKPQQRATLRVSVQQVRIDVTVRDKDDNLIKGLSPDYFEIYEDKVRQEITNFSPVEAPVTVVLVVEYNKRIWAMLRDAWMASHIFVQGMRPGDWVAVVAYDMRPEILVDFTQNQGEVYKALRSLNYPAFAEANVYDAVWDVLDRIQELEGRTAVILVSTGLDTFSKRNLSNTLKRVKSSTAPIYSVALGGNLRARYEHLMSTTGRMDFLQADSTLKSFAKYTGGEAFFPRFSSQFGPIFNTISLLLRNQYSLSYISTNPKRDGKFRKIKVKVIADLDGNGKNDKMKVNHRSGYNADKGS